MTSFPSLRGLQAFEAAARTGSFVSAAAELAISPAAVSQLIRALEDQISRKLFLRINRSVVLTEAGRDIFGQLSGAFQEIRTVSRELGGGERRATLVISVPPSVAVGWLPSRMKGFVDLHGSIDVSIRGEDDPVPFDRDLIDMRFTYGRSHYEEQDTEETGVDAVYPVCAPDLLSTYGLRNDAMNLLSAPLIHTDWGPSGASFPSWRRWFDSIALTPTRNIQRGMTANSSRAALDLACGGLGVALAQGLFCAPLIESGLLVIASGHSLPLSQPYAITIPRRSAQREALLAFKAWFERECWKAIYSPALARADSASGPARSKLLRSDTT